MTGDILLKLLGEPAESASVQAVLHDLARGQEPELDPDDEESLPDWILVNEIGLELGFEDQAYVNASAESARRSGSLVLTQLYFYGDTPTTVPFPFDLPFDLDFGDDRIAVRRKLAAFDDARRSHVRDAWSLKDFTAVAAYRPESGLLESFLCFVVPKPWPPEPFDQDLLSTFDVQRFTSLFGLRWSSVELRVALAPFDYDSALGEVRSEHTADLRMTQGIEFGFAPGRIVPCSDSNFGESFCLASVTYYGPRVYDARRWSGPLPFGLRFDDSQSAIALKLGRQPDEHEDFDRNGFALWHFEAFTLRVEYSNIENRLLRVTILAPGYWARTTIGSAAND